MNYHPSLRWTDKRIELLKKLWARGWSSSQIAAELGGVSRNSVIGKVHRLGLSGRAKHPPGTRRDVLAKAGLEPSRRSLVGTRLNPAVSLKSRTSKPLAQPREAIMVKSLKPVHILDRSMLTQCAWPLWMRWVPFSELMCCGNPIAPGEQSYCEGHAAMSANSYRPQREAA